MSFVIIIIQFIKLYIVWKEISKAENLHKDEIKFQEIEQNIEDFRRICDELAEIIRTHDLQHLSTVVRNTINTYNQTKSLINQLYITINESVQRLELYSYTGLDTVLNLTMAIGNAIQLYGVIQSISSRIFIIGSVMILGFGMLAIGNRRAYHVTQTRLHELRHDLLHLQFLENELEKIYKKL